MSGCDWNRQAPKPDMFPGSDHETNLSGPITITAYRSYDDVSVRFLRTGFNTITTAKAIRRGEVRDPYTATQCGIGFVGGGRFSVSSHSVAYQKWANMLIRVYAPLSPKMARSYAGCSVDPSWWNLQNFGDWFESQPFAGAKGYELDKDLIQPGNRTYSSDLCQIIPRELNNVLTFDKRENKYGSGVKLNKRKNVYEAAIKVGDKRIYLGQFVTSEEAAAEYTAAHQARVLHLAHELFCAGKITKQQLVLVNRHLKIGN